MKIKTSRLYYFPIYLILAILIVIFPHFLSLLLFFIFLIFVEIEINFNYAKISRNEITIYNGIFLKKITKVSIKDLVEIKLEKNPYLYFFGLSNLRFKTYNSEFILKGIRKGEKIFEEISKIKAKEAK